MNWVRINHMIGVIIASASAFHLFWVLNHMIIALAWERLEI